MTKYSNKYYKARNKWLKVLEEQRTILEEHRRIEHKPYLEKFEMKNKLHKAWEEYQKLRKG